MSSTVISTRCDKPFGLHFWRDCSLVRMASSYSNELPDEELGILAETFEEKDCFQLAELVGHPSASGTANPTPLKLLQEWRDRQTECCEKRRLLDEVIRTDFPVQADLLLKGNLKSLSLRIHSTMS